jgi:DNA-binding LacI/PurR family transcriptional regulator
LNFQPVRDRFLGYYQALEEAGIPFRPEYHKQGEHGRRVARKLAHTLLQQDDPPTAIFAFSDTQAVGVVEAARDLGLAVPADLSVIGFDDIDLAEHWHLTTMRQPLFETGRCGCEMLFHHLDNPAAPPQEIMLPTELVVRATTAPPA